MKKKRGRKEIVYIPYPVKGNKINEYTTNMVKILMEEYQVSGDLAELLDFGQMLHTKAVFLNWIEQELDFKMKAQLLLYKILGAKIIWVFHNKFPHDTELTDKVIDNMIWLANKSSVIILHSKSSRKYVPNLEKNRNKTFYIPHILYEEKIFFSDIKSIRIKYNIAENDFVFVIFGLIRPYKNIESAIEVFNKLNLQNAKLLIAGSPMSSSYAQKIEKLCDANNNIILDLRYISEAMLDNIIDISDVVLLPYKDGSSINSGVMIKAFSKGKTVIAPDICMARDMASKKFFYMYQNSLENVMLKAYRNGKDVNVVMGSRAKEYIYKHNKKEIVKERINKIL